MAVRTTAAAVGLIIAVNADISITPFIEVANNIVTQNCTIVDLTVATLELIERWLSAHFYRMRELQVAEKRAAPVSQSFQSTLYTGFDNSTYGQMAMRIDWSGALSSLNEQAKKGGLLTAGITWVGTPAEEDD